MFSHFLHIFSSVSPKRIKRVFYKIKYSELMFFIYVCVKKQMNYTTYLFDFDYTLADSSRGIVTCFRNVLNRHAIPARPTTTSSAPSAKRWKNLFPFFPV